MKKAIIAWGAATLIAAAAVGAPEAGNKRPPRERKMDKVERRGAGLTDEQRQRLRDRIATRRSGGIAPKGDGSGVGVGPAIRKRFIELFDRDGDGRLSEEERAALREDLKARRTKLMAKYDQDGDGALNESERAQVRADFIEFLKNAVATYDTDDDGILSPAERATAIQELWKTGAFLQP